MKVALNQTDYVKTDETAMALAPAEHIVAAHINVQYL
jgi:hypothetical protein